MTKQATLLPPLTTAEVLDLIRERIAKRRKDAGDQTVVRTLTKAEAIAAGIAQELQWVLDVVDHRGVK